MIPVGQDRLDDLLLAQGVRRPYSTDRPRMPHEGVFWGDQAFERGYAYELESVLWPKWVDNLSVQAGEKEYRRRENYSGRNRDIMCPRGTGWYPTWLENAGDCENQGIQFMAFCGRQNAYTARMRNSKRFGFALIGLAYMAESKPEDSRSGGHFRCCLVDENKDTKGNLGCLRPFEQATGTFMTLTQTEWKSVWFATAF